MRQIANWRSCWERIGKDMSDGDGRSKLCEYEHEMSILDQLDDAEKTIEAQQQEIEQLKSKNDVLENDHINLEMNLSNVTADLDEQAGRIVQLEKLAKDLYFAYINKDEDFPHSFETKAIEQCKALLGGKRRQTFFTNDVVIEGCRRRRGRMKFDEIVKALRLCGETTECISERIGCPYCENTDDCKRELLFDAADIIEAQQQEIDRLQRWVNDLQSGMYVNCVYCGHRYGMEKDTPVAMADVLKEHIEHCSKHPMSKLKQEIEQLRDENISIRNWNACEEEQYGQLLESDKRRIKLEEQIEAQQQEIKQLEYTLKKARDLIENANSNGILEHVARNCMFIKEIDDLLGGEKDE